MGASTIDLFDDIDLWRRFQEGDPAAFDAIYSRYAPALYNYGMHLIRDKDAVKDCLHDFYVYLWQKRERLGRISSLKNYLLISFRRKLLDEKSKNHIRLFSSLPAESTFYLDRSHEEGIIALEIEKEYLGKLQSAFERLTDRQKEALYLRFYENMEYFQIAEALDLKNIKYARTLVYRSISQLKENLSESEINFLSSANHLVWLMMFFFIR